MQGIPLGVFFHLPSQSGSPLGAILAKLHQGIAVFVAEHYPNRTSNTVGYINKITKPRLTPPPTSFFFFFFFPPLSLVVCSDSCWYGGYPSWSWHEQHHCAKQLPPSGKQHVSANVFS